PAFARPWRPALIVIAVAGAASVRLSRLGPALAVLLVGVGLVNLAMKSGVVEPVARPHFVHLGELGNVPILDGRGIIQIEVASAGFRIGSPTQPLPPLHRQWLPLARRVVGFIIDRARREGQNPQVLVAMDDGLFNNTRL